jgi:NADPH:quinone reductase-like Zn-dependent oxidoreductase
LIKQRLTMFISQEHHSFIERLGTFIESGSVTPSIGQRFGLEEVPAAVRQMEAGTARGKSVIVVRP